MQYKLMGSSVRQVVKKGVFPHKFDCEKGREMKRERPLSVKRNRRDAIQQLMKN